MDKYFGITFVVATLAVWRLSHMMADIGEGGPYGIFNYIRSKIGVRVDAATGMPYGKNMFSEMTTCVYCNSIWLGVAMALCIKHFEEETFWLSLPLAISAVAIQLEHRM